MMKKILAFCVICLFTAIVCQAEDKARFSVIDEAKTPTGNACACSKVNNINSQKPTNTQLASDLVQIEKLDKTKFTEEEIATIQAAQKLQKDIKGMKTEFEPVAMAQVQGQPLTLPEGVVRGPNGYGRYVTTLNGKKVTPGFWKKADATKAALRKIVDKYSKITGND